MATSTAQPNPAFIRVWDIPLRLFHWSLVAAIAVAFLSSDEDSAIADWHVAAGWTAAVLIAFRLAWGFLGSENARFASFVRPSGILPHLRGLRAGHVERTLGHNPAGAIAVLVLLASVAAVAATGYLALQGGEEELHEVVAWGLLALMALHIVAVIATSMLSGENLTRAMVTGRKRAADHPNAQSTTPSSIVGLLVALGIAGALAAVITTFDPSPFSLKDRETSEQMERHTGGFRMQPDADGPGIGRKKHNENSEGDERD